MAKIRVLIADDHAILRSGVRMLLEQQPDMEVVAEAADAALAIQKTAETSPDVVLLDISMPGSTGTQTVERVLGACETSRVLILTMHDDLAYLRSALASGAAGYMVKTGADDELLNAIRAVHKGRSYIDVSLADSSLQQVLAQKAKRKLPGASQRDLLSGRERQVLELVAYGHTHKEIAAQLEVSVKSVETYRSRLAEKLGLRSRADLVRYALDHGILRSEGKE